MGAKKTVDQEFLSTGTIAKKMNCSTETIRREIKRGKLRAQAFNGNFLVAVSDFEEWKARNIVPVTDV